MCKNLTNIKLFALKRIGTIICDNHFARLQIKSQHKNRPDIRYTNSSFTFTENPKPNPRPGSKEEHKKLVKHCVHVYVQLWFETESKNDTRRWRKRRVTLK
jgi:hypothetical protein